ncbi:hypothetical protein [Corticicoccus populi]|uniref:Sodium:solute symporter n=1 Tax=Corticicoccus populi TaxID=1812821 RepID=A0ABW5WZP5_9STAP
MRDEIKKYVLTNKTVFDISFGVLLFILRWLSITIVVFSSELLINYGILGAISFILAMGAALILFSEIARRIKQRFHNKSSLEDIINIRTEGITRRVMLTMLLLLNLSLLVIQVFAVTLMLDTVFNLPAYTGHMIFFSLLFFYVVIGKGKVIIRLSPLFVTIIFSSVILIPVYFFIQEGVKPVYDGIWLYHPYLLYWKNDNNLPLVLTSFLLFLSILTVDRTTWQRLLALKTNQVREAISMSGITIVTILLAVISMVLISLSNEGYTNASTVLFNLVHQLQSPVLIGLFISFCFVISLSALGSEVHTLVKIIQRSITRLINRNERLTKVNEPVLVLLVILVLFFIGLYAPNNLLGFLFAYGIICASMITPMLIIILTKYSLPRHTVLIIFSAITLGFVMYYAYGIFSGVWVSFLLSAGITGLTYSVQLLKRNRY